MVGTRFRVMEKWRIAEYDCSVVRQLISSVEDPLTFYTPRTDSRNHREGVSVVPAVRRSTMKVAATRNVESVEGWHN